MVESSSISAFCIALGWLYFICWSVSFYPQVLLNWRRKSVRGLSFEYQAYNITGYLCYSIYSIVTYIKQKESGITLSIEPNDIAFAVHASLITVFTIFQCFIYKTDREKLHLAHAYLASLMWVILLYNLCLSGGGIIDWYSTDKYCFISYLGYVKVAVSFIKYCPQVRTTIQIELMSTIIKIMFNTENNTNNKY